MYKINILDCLKENTYEYKTILQFVPYYEELREYLEKINITDEQEIIKFVKENYKNSIIYKELKESNIEESIIQKLIVENSIIRYITLVKSLEIMKNSAIECCDIVDYISHYPTTCPAPTEKEKNLYLENLFDQYDIIVRYYFYDNYRTLQIDKNDIVRITTHLKECLDTIKSLKKEINSKELYLTNFIEKEEGIKLLEIIQGKAKFPLSSYQEKGKSRREEGKMYLRRQFGNKII